MTRTFIPRFKEYNFPTDEDYKHFMSCEIRNQGKLFKCKQCKYVWEYWYGTNISFKGK